MHVITPGQLAARADSKYLGVLVAAKFARNLNEFRRGQLADEPATGEIREKLTTTALEAVARGTVQYSLSARKAPSEQ
ncbi:MAG: DNA-directed RNA polymerase subunit omega [Gemmatimonadota bacterium]|jgi:DNA-directed RNA polymerase omega subunit|nr:DNA-directed RNA polymerase subunit omega [Gemmatimonadota bacterium]